jgi:hypothetical protein
MSAMAISLNLFSLILLAVCICFPSGILGSFPISFELFEETDHKCYSFGGGTCQMFTIEDNSCLDFDFWNTRTSSINTKGNCIKLWSERDCSGKFLIMAPNTRGHADLGTVTIVGSSVSWNKKVVSISGCDYQVRTPSSTQCSNGVRKKRATHEAVRTTPVLPLFQKDRNTIAEEIDEEGNPVYRVLYSNRPARRLRGIQAEIWFPHLTRVRAGFGGGPGTVWHNQMIIMQSCGYWQHDCVTDVRGHMVASSFSGPIAWYNLAPLTPAVNADRGLPGTLVESTRKEAVFTGRCYFIAKRSLTSMNLRFRT